ncbi:MAG: UbiA family prenyltransferase [Candidatus Aenigmatarchaeota archaeon]
MFRKLFLVSRPLLWCIFLLVFLLGMAAGEASVSLISVIQAVSLTVPLGLFCNGLNDVYDYSTDRKNRNKGKLRGLPLNPEGGEAIKWASAVCCIIVLAVSLAAGNVANVVGVLSIIAIGYAYSVPLIRLKDRPPFDSISSGICFFFLPFLIGASYGNLAVAFQTPALLLTLVGMGMHSLAALADYTADKESGSKTIAVAFGPRAAAVFAAMPFFAGLSVALLFPSLLCTQCAVPIAYFIASSVIGMFVLIKPNDMTGNLGLKLQYLTIFIAGPVYVLVNYQIFSFWL